MSKYLINMHRMNKYFPILLLFGAMNVFIATRTGILADTYFPIAVFLAANALFILTIKLVKRLRTCGSNGEVYSWFDAKQIKPRDASQIKVVIRHNGSLCIVNAFYDVDLYKDYNGWGAQLMRRKDDEVILWRYCTFEELREY